MIKLTKGSTPAVLATNAAAWTNMYLTRLASGVASKVRRRPRYNHPQIKTALLEETNEKCAYCESKFGHVTFGDVEHITAKSSQPQRAFEWFNLTIACDICNQSKSDREGVIDPYQDDPSEHFFFLGPMVVPKPGDSLGRDSFYILDLNRLLLMGKRAERIEKLRLMIETLVKENDPSGRLVLMEELEKEKQDHKEFAATCRSFISEMQPLLDSGSP